MHRQKEIGGKEDVFGLETRARTSMAWQIEFIHSCSAAHPARGKRENKPRSRAHVHIHSCSNCHSMTEYLANPKLSNSTPPPPFTPKKKLPSPTQPIHPLSKQAQVPKLLLQSLGHDVFSGLVEEFGRELEPFALIQYLVVAGEMEELFGGMFVSRGRKRRKGG